MITFKHKHDVNNNLQKKKIFLIVIPNYVQMGQKIAY
jgi:hypothetical protein